MVRVRVEAPASVDDTVVYYADGHVAYIQSKERVQKGEEAWRKLWRDFLDQYHAADFSRGRDRLVLHVGETRGEYTTLLELCERAGFSAEEWLGKRLGAPHRKLLSEIGTLLGPDLPGDDQALHDFFAHVDVELWPSQQLQRIWAPNYMPATSVPAQTLFSLLRDRVGGAARHRDDFEARTLREELRDEHQVEFQIPPEIDTLRAAVHDCGADLRLARAPAGAPPVRSLHPHSRPHCTGSGTSATKWWPKLA